jgi:hypothetical protein
MAKASTSRKKTGPETATSIRDGLPFFKSGRGKVATSWWNVSPSGNYSEDLETGMEYAKAFLPLMAYNAGASSLGTVVSHMAIAGRDPSRVRPWRGIDAVALGFLMGIGGSLQSAMASVAIAAVAIERPRSDLGDKFVAHVKRGDAFRPLRRGTLAHNPNALMFDAAVAL